MKRKPLVNLREWGKKLRLKQEAFEKRRILDSQCSLNLVKSKRWEVPLENSRWVGTLQEEYSRISHTGFCQFSSCSVLAGNLENLYFFYWLLRYIETVYLIGDFCGQDIRGGNTHRNLLYLSSKLVVPVFATNNLFLNKTIFFGTLSTSIYLIWDPNFRLEIVIFG